MHYDQQCPTIQNQQYPTPIHRSETPVEISNCRKPRHVCRNHRTLPRLQPSTCLPSMIKNINDDYSLSRNEDNSLLWFDTYIQSMPTPSDHTAHIWSQQKFIRNEHNHLSTSTHFLTHSDSTPHSASSTTTAFSHYCPLLNTCIHFSLLTNTSLPLSACHCSTHIHTPFKTLTETTHLINVRRVDVSLRFYYHLRHLYECRLCSLRW